MLAIQVKQELKKAVMWKEKQLKENEVFPPCNSEWNKDKGGRVWCTTKSGGIARGFRDILFIDITEFV